MWYKLTPAPSVFIPFRTAMLILFVVTVSLTRIVTTHIVLELDRIEQLGAEHLLNSTGLRVRKFNRTLSVLDGTFSILQYWDDSIEISMTAARSALGNNQFNEYPMKIPRKGGCQILLDEYAEFQHIWLNDTNLPQVDKKAPPAPCGIPKGNFWMKNLDLGASWIPPVVPEGFWRMTWHFFDTTVDELEGQVLVYGRVKKDML